MEDVHTEDYRRGRDLTSKTKTKNQAEKKLKIHTPATKSVVGGKKRQGKSQTRESGWKVFSDKGEGVLERGRSLSRTKVFFNGGLTYSCFPSN